MEYTKENLEKSIEFLEKEILDSKNRINKFCAENNHNKYHPIARIVVNYRRELKKLHLEMSQDIEDDF